MNQKLLTPALKKIITQFEDQIWNKDFTLIAPQVILPIADQVRAQVRILVRHRVRKIVSTQVSDQVEEQLYKEIK